MKHLLVIILLVFSVFSRAEISVTSIGELYKAPNIYSGQVVELTGWLELHYDGNVVCENEDLISAECVEIELDQSELYNAFQGKEVQVTGTFYPVELYDSKANREGETLSIQLGSSFHRIGNVIKIEMLKTVNR